VANLLAFQPDERIAEVLALRDYQVAPYLVLATRSGLVKKSKLTAFDSPRSGGIIAINLREDDEVIAARLVSPEEDLLLVSKGAQAIRFHADDESLRPMGRDTSGVIGMRFNDGDELLGMYVVRDGGDVLVATGGGYAKRTPVDAYPVQGRGGPRRGHGQDRRSPRRAGRRADGDGRRRDLRHHLGGRGDQDPGQRGQAVGSADHGGAPDEPCGGR
jgi:DNA gyrase subunit A